jgi:hypothetical protein
MTFPIKFSEAVSLYTQNKGFMSMSKQKKEEYLLPFKNMDKAEAELKNLDIANTSDQLANRLKIVRRNANIQKDFFSMLEYLVWGTNQAIENDYYKQKKKQGKERVLCLIN